MRSHIRIVEPNCIDLRRDGRLALLPVATRHGHRPRGIAVNLPANPRLGRCIHEPPAGTGLGPARCSLDTHVRSSGRSCSTTPGDRARNPIEVVLRRDRLELRVGHALQARSAGGFGRGHVAGLMAPAMGRRFLRHPVLSPRPDAGLPGGHCQGGLDRTAVHARGQHGQSGHGLFLLSRQLPGLHGILSRRPGRWQQGQAQGGSAESRRHHAGYRVE